MTSAPWPPRRTALGAAARPIPDIEALTGLRSGKPHPYTELRTSAERLRRVIQSLERISAALVRTMEGSEALVRAVVEAVADHLSADWVAFALVSDELPDARPRHLVRGPDGVEWPDLATVPTRVLGHVEAIHARADDDTHHDTHHEEADRHLHVPIRLGGRAVGGFVAWTPPERQIDDTDRSVLRILAGQTAAALENCALLEHSERLYAHATNQAVDLRQRNAELVATQAELGAARQREVLDDERHRIARELHDSVTQYALSAGMHIDVVRSEIADPRLRAQLDTATDLTRRAVEQLRSAIYALNEHDGHGAPDLPSMLRRLSGVHMPDELRVEVRIGGAPVPLPGECEQSLFRVAGEALFNTAVHGDATRAVVRLAYRDTHIRLTVSDDGGGSPEAVRRSLRAATATSTGAHRGLVNMQARARELGGTLTFRRARLGGLQVQVDVPVERRCGDRTGPPTARPTAGPEARSAP